MKRIKLMMLAACLLGGPTASAQYYEMANQVSNLISPALSGSLNYKGFVEFSGTAGVGPNRANFVGISTTQGFQYSNWFFMGAGIGFDLTMGQDSDYSRYPSESYPGWVSHSSSKTRVVMPIFTDFRFNIGNNWKDPSFFIDIKVGGAWLLGSHYLELRDKRMSTSSQFYLKPSMGFRVPVNSDNPRQAINFGVSYQLLTSGNNYSWYGNSLTLSSFGASISYEW